MPDLARAARGSGAALPGWATHACTARGTPVASAQPVGDRRRRYRRTAADAGDAGRRTARAAASRAVRAAARSGTRRARRGGGRAGSASMPRTSTTRRAAGSWRPRSASSPRRASPHYSAPTRSPRHRSRRSSTVSSSPARSTGCWSATHTSQLIDFKTGARVPRQRGGSRAVSPEADGGICRRARRNLPRTPHRRGHCSTPTTRR